MMKIKKRFDTHLSAPHGPQTPNSMSSQNPIEADRDRAHKYLRGDFDAELFAKSAATVISPDPSIKELEKTARSHGIRKLHGQRGITVKGASKLIEVVSNDLQYFPSFKKVRA